MVHSSEVGGGVVVCCSSVVGGSVGVSPSELVHGVVGSGVGSGVCSSVVVQGVVGSGSGVCSSDVVVHGVEGWLVAVYVIHEQAEETASTFLLQFSNSVGMASGAVVVPERKSKQKLTPRSANWSSTRLR